MKKHFDMEGKELFVGDVVLFATLNKQLKKAIITDTNGFGKLTVKIISEKNKLTIISDHKVYKLEEETKKREQISDLKEYVTRKKSSIKTTPPTGITLENNCCDDTYVDYGHLGAEDIIAGTILASEILDEATTYENYDSYDSYDDSNYDSTSSDSDYCDCGCDCSYDSGSDYSCDCGCDCDW